MQELSPSNMPHKGPETKRGSLALSENHKIDLHPSVEATFHKRKGSNLQDYVRLRVGTITGSVLNTRTNKSVGKPAAKKADLNAS